VCRRAGSKVEAPFVHRAFDLAALRVQRPVVEPDLVVRADVADRVALPAEHEHEDLVLVDLGDQTLTVLGQLRHRPDAHQAPLAHRAPPPGERPARRRRQQTPNRLNGAARSCKPSQMMALRRSREPQAIVAIRSAQGRLG